MRVRAEAPDLDIKSSYVSGQGIRSRLGLLALLLHSGTRTPATTSFANLSANSSPNATPTRSVADFLALFPYRSFVHRLIDFFSTIVRRRNSPQKVEKSLYFMKTRDTIQT